MTVLNSLLIGRFVGGGHGGFAAFLNMGVHTVMYLYYFLTGTYGSSNLLIIYSLDDFNFPWGPKHPGSFYPLVFLP
jgi:hypothetical protein